MCGLKRTTPLVTRHVEHNGLYLFATVRQGRWWHWSRVRSAVAGVRHATTTNWTFALNKSQKSAVSLRGTY